MNETTNYKLKKPEGNDFVSVTAFNENSDILDRELKAVSENVEKATKRRNISLAAASWSAEYPYTQSVALEGITEDTDLKVIGLYIPDGATADQVKTWNKAASCLMTNVSGTGNGVIVFKAHKKPSSDFTVVVEGG